MGRRSRIMVTAGSLALGNFWLYLWFPMPGFRRWDGLMTATSIAKFQDTPWDVLLFFAHTLVIPLTRAVDLLVPGNDPLLTTAIREIFFSSLNVAVLYLFFRTLLKTEYPAILMALAYIFCHAHWKFATGGEEKDTMLFFNMIFLIGYFRYKGWMPGESGMLERSGKTGVWLWCDRRTGYHPEILLGILLALACMVHLENGILGLTILVTALVTPRFYGQWRQELRALGLICGVCGILLLLWFGFIIVGVNRITSLEEALRWLFEYHVTGEFLDMEVLLTDQFVRAYTGFRRFLIGAYFEWPALWLEMIAVSAVFLVLVWRALKYSPDLVRPALVYIILVGVHFFFWVPWDPEQWNPVVFAGFIVLGSGAFSSRNGLITISALVLVGLLMVTNISHYRQEAALYRPIADFNRNQNPTASKGCAGNFRRYSPYTQLVQAASLYTEAGSIVLVDYRHLVNHFLIYTDLEPIYIPYLDQDDFVLRTHFYLTKLSLEFYKPRYSTTDITQFLDSGGRIYYLTNNWPPDPELLERFAAGYRMIVQLPLSGFCLVELQPREGA